MTKLTKKEWQQIIIDWNNTSCEYQKDKLIHQLFEEQVEKTPNNTAIIYENTQLTYKALNERTNQLARYIRKQYKKYTGRNLHPDVLIPVCLDRGIDMIIGILGVLKAGGAYVPIDPNYPDQRIDYILRDTSSNLIVTQAHFSNRLESVISAVYTKNPDALQSATQIITLDSQKYGQENRDNLPQYSKPNDLAYVIYTSGTTGNPKGVMVEHKSVVNLINNHANEFIIKNHNPMRCLQFASLVFDAHVSEIYVCITTGQSLYIASDEQRKDSNLLRDLLDKQQIELATIPPAILNVTNRLFSSLKVLICAGEPTSVEVLDKYYNAGVEVINAYGPSESTVCSSLNHYTKNHPNNIGKALGNIKHYVLDSELLPVSIGTVGELYIGGMGLARGYLNKPELTEEQFIDNPFVIAFPVFNQTNEFQGEAAELIEIREYSSRPLQNLFGSLQTGKGITRSDKAKAYTRLYKTGDLVKWMPDGNLEYVGRKDFQTKINGNRVELSEIENALMQHQNIQQVAVLANQNGTNSSNKTLACYYVPKYQKNYKIELFPSVAEYYVYDDALYGAMTNHITRNECYRKAISKCVKNKTVVDIGTGPEAILSRICVEEGASHVYAIEYLRETYLKASQKIKELGLEDKITLIHGDSTKITLPEKVDICVSEIVGAIGGSEGATVIINDAKKRHVKTGGVFIPERSITKIAGVTLPEDLVNYPYLEDIPHKYVQDIFNDVGYEFNLRLCLKGITSNELVTTEGFLEDLNWGKEDYISPNNEQDVRLDITKKETMYGFLVWLYLKIDNQNIVDILSDQGSWVPIYFPVFPNGISVEEGDHIQATISRSLIENLLNCDYSIKGKLHSKKGVTDFSYTSAHYAQKNSRNKFYDLFLEMYRNRDNYNLNLLHDNLAKKLPNYMIPSVFIPMKEFPLTVNGKLDRKVLANTEIIKDEDDYIVPRTELESKLCSVWEKVLGVSKVGIQDDFFKIGGDSIKAIQIVAALREYGFKVKANDILKLRTIDGLKDKVDFFESQEVQKSVEGSFPLMPIQNWFFKSYNGDHNKFHQSILMQNKCGIDDSIITQTLKNIVEHHDALRMKFYNQNNHWYQYNESSAARFSIKTINIGNNDTLENIIHDRVGELIEQSNIGTQSFLFHALIFTTPNKEDYIFLLAHHLIIDTVSWGILLEDLVTTYDQLLSQDKNLLPSKTTSYKEWSESISRYRNSDRLRKQLPYWQNIESTDIYNIPSDSELETYKNKSEISQKILDVKITDNIINSNQTLSISMKELLLTCFSRTLSNVFGKHKFAIDFEGHGREEIFETLNVSRTIGWFTSFYPVICNQQNNYTLLEDIKHVQDQLLAIPDNGIGYSILKFIEPNDTKNKISYHLKPQISFNYYGSFNSKDQSKFKVIKEPDAITKILTGDSQYGIELSAAINFGRLSFSIKTNNNKFTKITNQKLTSEFEKIILNYANVNQSSIEPILQKSGKYAQNTFNHRLKQIIHKVHVPGIAGAIQFKNGETIFSCNGQSNITTQKNIVLDDHFRIGSITKTFVSTIILQLVQEQKIKLDSSISNYLDKNINDNITVRHLLNHSSGIKDYVKNPLFYKQCTDNPSKYWMPSELLYYGISQNHSFHAIEQGKYLYSSTGYIILGLIIEFVTKNNIQCEINNRILKPLNLRNTFFDYNMSTNNKLVSGHFSNNQILTLAHNFCSSSGWAAGSMISNVQDMLIWSNALINGQLINQELHRERMKFSTAITTDHDENIRVGLGIFDINGKQGQVGEFFGYTTVMLNYDGFNVVLLMNGEINNIRIYDFIRYVFSSDGLALEQ